MFSSIAIPAILQRQAVGSDTDEMRVTEKVAASMTVEKPANSQQAGHREGQSDAGTASTDANLTLTMLYEQFRRPIHSYIYRLLGSQEDADDVTQEVFVRACTAWNGLYEREHLSPWLYRIATNLCVDLLRRRKRISWWSLSQRFRNDDSSDHGISDDTAYFLSDSGGIPEIAEREHIRMALKSMPEEYAVALVLSAAQGLPYQEIADILNISPNAAATRISRAKKMFAEQYSRVSQDQRGSKGGVAKQERFR